MNGWLLFPCALFVLATGAAILNIVFNCIDYWHAARRGEDAKATEGTGSSSW